MIRTDCREQGFALAATIFALVLVGALVTGGFFAASQESRIGTNSRFSSEAFYYAERGLQDALGTYTRGFLQTQMTAVPDSFFPQTVTITSNGQPVGEYTLSVRRLDSLLYYIEATGQVLEGGLYSGATRTLGVVARAVNLNLPADRALQIFGQVSIGGTSEVDGRDSHPSDWAADCGPLAPDVTGIATSDSSLVDVFGSGDVFGNPQIHEDPQMDSTSFSDFGDLSFDELAAQRDKFVPAGTGPINNIGATTKPDGSCDIDDNWNWGEPFNDSHPCYNYFPIIYAEANLKLNGTVAGQGILLVEGDLELTGGFQFFGITIVKGSLKTTGRGGHLNGITLVRSGGSLDSNWESVARGNSEVNFSSCAIERAITNNPLLARIVPIAQRSWIDLTAAGG